MRPAAKLLAEIVEILAPDDDHPGHRLLFGITSRPEDETVRAVHGDTP
jgi:hypothetical protein